MPSKNTASDDRRKILWEIEQWIECARTQAMEFRFAKQYTRRMNLCSVIAEAEKYASIIRVQLWLEAVELTSRGTSSFRNLDAFTGSACPKK